MKTLLLFVEVTVQKPKFGIASSNGNLLGFVFVGYNEKVSNLRNIIKTDLRKIISDTFVFLDKYNWPVAEQQEESVIVWDLERNKVITISLNFNRELKGNDVGDGGGEIGEDEATENELESPINRVRHQSDGKLSTATTALLDNTQDKDSILSLENSILQCSSNGHKPILISYVRQEAERHARQLKLCLEDIGCQVFLDIDEIKGGHDWQDALNRAVVNCSIFVPLITPLYGYTQWTNREVKLADMKAKVIIPVNFLDHWPPECLAIQFASTQYLDWKSKLDIEEAILTQGERARDIRYWDEPFVQRTAEEIWQRFLAFTSAPLDQSITSFSNSHSFTAKSSLQEDVVDKLDMMSSEASVEPDSVPQTSTLVECVTKIGKTAKTLFRSSASPVRQLPLIVISAHPKERNFVELLRKRLQEVDFQVWSSTDMCIGSSFEQINSDLPTIDDLSPASPICHSLPIIPALEDNVFNNNNGSFVIPEESEESQQSQQFIVPAIKPIRPRFLDTFCSLNAERKYSQSSDVNGSQHSLFTPEDRNKANEFKRRVNKGRMVIVVFSQAFVSSKTCKSQLFYCEDRITVFPIVYEECKISHCIMKLIGNDLFKRDALFSPSDDDSFVTSVVTKANNLINASKETFKTGMKEAKILSLCKLLSKKIPFFNDKRKTVIFVTGGSKFFNTSSEAVCSSIAQVLAAKENDIRLKCRQQQDKSFEVLPFGETLFIGDCLQERDAVIARIFHYCILIEGGPYSANLAKEFLWNDNTVIPIMSTGGAASGQYDCIAKITEMPACVDESDWQQLGEKGNSPDDTANTVLRVVNSLVEWRKKNCSEKKRNCHYFFNRNRRKFNRNLKAKKEVLIETQE
ncbi:uncharacterized protein B4U80_09778 [Leptotrombidium deliense]|uniref:TIR domain-containing protein n=1 Tax=Leptotrombidium deliense TaxID=299467 RepID=A0A443SSN5_9ACAR|nr:uncharacterized protein B4U80_09778 [Leptotrombidium deliense]